MPLTLNCPKCSKPFRVREESAGMRVKCPSCSTVLQVPASLSSSSLGGATSVPSQERAIPAAKTERQLAPEAAPKQTGDTARAESFLGDRPEPGPHSDSRSRIPSIAPTQPMMQRRDSATDRTRETGPLPSPRKSASKARPREDEAHPEQIVQDAEGWRKVRKGLYWTQLAFFLALLPAIGNLTVIAYGANAEGKSPDKLTDKGLLSQSLTLWQELEYGYLFVIPALIYAILFVGRARLLAVPESARTRGTATGLVLLTLVTFAAFATFACSIMLPKLTGDSLPREVKSIAWTVFIYFGLLAEGWYLLVLGQIGVPLRSTRTLRDTALSLLILVVAIAGVQIANDFYPLLTSSPKVKVDELLNTQMIQAGVYLVIAFVFVFRVTAVTGIIRRAIARWNEEHKDTLQAAPE